MIEYKGYKYYLAESYQDVGFSETGRWGNAGSGCLFTTGEHILLLKRSPYVEEPGTWGLPGGAVPETASGGLKDTLASALKETREELGVVPSHYVVDHYVYREPGFSYTTFICRASQETNNFYLNWENTDWGWFGDTELDSLNLHFGVVEVLTHTGVFDL